MKKWFEKSAIDETPIISSRVRLARNFNKYPFSAMITDSDVDQMMEETVKVVQDAHEYESDAFEFLPLHEASALDKRVMLEQHVISNAFFKSDKHTGLLKQKDDSVNIMLNEEDHIRIQCIKPGNRIEEALSCANQLDDCIEENLDYAFDKDFGYLTSCPTNTGTGLRASFMVHPPFLEKTGQLKNIISALSKFGMTVRGIYGEGTEPVGSIYQISNQLTLGKSEEEIIQALQNVVKQITDNEALLMEKALKADKWGIEDSVYRSYGVLTNCRKITSKEAMNLLSNIRLGFVSGLLQVEKPKMTIYQMMMNIQPGNLTKLRGKELDEIQRDVYRADFLRNTFN